MATARIKILRELRQFYAEWRNSWLAARDITVFRRDAAGFGDAARDLVAEGLVLRIGGADDAEAAFRLNPARFAELRHELKPPLWRVLVLVLFSLIAAGLAFHTMQRGWGYLD